MILMVEKQLYFWEKMKRFWNILISDLFRDGFAKVLIQHCWTISAVLFTIRVVIEGSNEEVSGFLFCQNEITGFVNF